jgi:DNA ligase-associated metallophosphoesterase
LNPSHVLKIAGTELLLLADKAAYWPDEKTLLVADIHFGKAAAYRALGQPVPRGTTTNNLLRLDRLLAEYECSRLIFLGDFLHAPKSHAPATLAAIEKWHGRHAKLDCILVRGNHDLRAGDPPARLGIELVDEPFLMGPFALRHIPVPHATHHVIAGHLHPVFNLHGKGYQSLRLPCFSCDTDITLLPSFGDFTGGMAVTETPGRRIFVTEGSGVWAII